MKKLVFLGFIFFSLLARGDYWTRKADFGGWGRQEAVGFCIGTKAYIGTGWQYAPGYLYEDFWEYDPTNDVWTQKADFGGGHRIYAAGFAIGNKGYIGLGMADTLGNGNDFWEYDPATNIWMRKADFGGIARIYQVGFSIGNKGYIGTGGDTSSLLKDFWEYDPIADVWTRKADFGGTARIYATGFNILNKGYVTGGLDSSGGNNGDFWEYNPAGDVWTQKASLQGSSGVGFSIDSIGYIGTGSSSSSFSKEFWQYNPATDRWTQKTDFGGLARVNATGFSIGTKGYIGMGGVPSGHWIIDFSDFWEYTPDSTTSINELSIINQLSIFPNPSDGSFSIQFSEAIHNPAIAIYNNMGQKVFEKKEEGMVKEIPVQLPAAAPGVYFLKVGEEVRKIVVQ